MFEPSIEPELRALSEAWRSVSPWCSLSPPASADLIAAFESKHRVTIPFSMRCLLGMHNGVSVLGGNTNVEALNAADACWNRRVRGSPEQVLWFGDDGSDDQFHIVQPHGDGADAPILATSDFAWCNVRLVGSTLAAFLRARTAYYLAMYAHDIGSREWRDDGVTFDDALRAARHIGMPRALLDVSPDDVPYASILEWADPDYWSCLRAINADPRFPGVQAEDF